MRVLSRRGSLSGVSRGLLLYLIGCLVLGTPGVEAAVWYVSASAGNNANDGATAGTPFKTLTHALTQASLAAGDVIKVLPGTYDIANGETFPLPIKPGVGIVADTIVSPTLPDGDPGAANRPRIIVSGPAAALRTASTSPIDATTRIEGLFLGRDPLNLFSYSLIEANPAPSTFSPTIVRNRFEHPTSGGDGIYINFPAGANHQGSPLIEENAFANLDEAIYQWINNATGVTMNPVIRNNTFSNNNLDVEMSGWSSIAGQVAPLIADNTSTGSGQFLYVSFGVGTNLAFSPTIRNNSFTGDAGSSDGLSMYLYTESGSPQLTPLIENNVIHVTDDVIRMSASFWSSGAALGSGGPAAMSAPGAAAITNALWSPTIRGNTLTSTGGGVAISLSTSISAGSATASPLIDNNAITSTAGYGIYQSAEMYGSGPQVVSPTITGNTITAAYAIALSMTSMSLAPGTTGTYSPTIDGNQINVTNGGTGIEMFFEDVSSGDIVGDVTIANNALTSDGTCCGAGMSLSMSWFSTPGTADVNWTIANNTVSGFEYEGIFFEISELSGDLNGLEGTVDVLVSGNTVTNNNDDGISLSISPYNFTGTQNILVQGNTTTGNAGFGINISVSSQQDVTSNSIQVLSNVISSNALGGLALWIEDWTPGGTPTNPTLVSGNTITNNALSQPASANFYGGVLLGGGTATPDFGGGNRGSSGGNTISGNGSWDFINTTSSIVKAEMNSWGSTSAAAIDARIRDDNESTLFGLVDFEPFVGGCPTAVTAVSPASGAQMNADGMLSWSGGTGADQFKVYLGPAGSGCTTLLGTTTATQIAFSGLATGEYDWKVVAESASCTTPPQSACVRFMVSDPCPNPAPVSIAPAPDAESAPETRFEWTVVANALQYHLMTFTATGGLQELAVLPQPAAPLPGTMSTTATVPFGTVSWWVVADFPDGCPSVSSTDRVFRVVQHCPTGSPQPVSPLDAAAIDETPVLFRWTPVDGTVRYELFLSLNGSAFQSAGSVEGTATEPSLLADVPAGALLAWYVEATFADGCGTVRSRTVEVSVSCFPPVLSLQGEVTTDKPYQVRATIVSVGQTYLFEESDTPAFGTVLASKQGIVDPTGEFVFAEFEHGVTEPRAFYYRVRLAQQGCDFSDVGRIVVVPLPSPTSSDTETVVQFGNEEEIRQQLFIPSPTPDRETSYSYIASTDRDWMRVEPAGGTIGQSGVTVTVITNPVGLPVGTNTGTVILTFVELAGGKDAFETTPVTTSAPVSVTLVTPVTNTGKAPPSAASLIIPAVAHASGIDSEWQTDMRLFNMGTEKQKYALNLTVSGEDGTQFGKSSEIELASGQNTALNDVVKQWYGLGSLPGESATGVLEIRPLGAVGAGKGPLAVPVTRALVSLASSRTYNRTPEGTLGEHIPALPFASFVGGGAPAGGEKSILSIQQLAQSSAYRSNLGVVEASGHPVDVEIRVYDGEGAKMLTVPLSLKAGEHRQLNQILAVNGLTDIGTARAEVEVVSGDGRIAAYGSVVDNVTGDPLQVSAVDLAKLGARKYVMPGIAHFNTGQARWRTDVQVFNAGLASVSAQVAFFPVGASAASKTATIEVGPGKIHTLSNIVPTLFGESNTGGAIQISTAASSELVVTGRTYDQRDEGSYGQFMAAVTEDDAIGLGDRAMQVLQLEQSSEIRSNLGLVEVTGHEVRVELSAFPAESRVTPRVELTLKPNEFRQLNAVLQALNAGTTYNARVALRVIGGEGKIVAYGSTVDNRTQDPTYIPGQ